MTFVIETGQLVQGLVNAVIEDADFDATPEQALRWLTARQRTMSARSLCNRKTLNLGSTVSGQDIYGLPPGIIRVLEVSVGGLSYGEARHADFVGLLNAWSVICGPGGVAARQDTAMGTTQLRIFPAGGQEAQPISVYAVTLAPDLALADDSTLVVPPEYYEALVSGAIATGTGRGEARPDLASAFGTEFAEACQELKMATRRKFRRSGALQLRV